MIRPLLDAACREAICQATHYIQTMTIAFTGPWSPLFATENWRTVIAAVDRAALAGDLRATQDACRQWWGLAIAYAHDPQEGGNDASLP